MGGDPPNPPLQKPEIQHPGVRTRGRPPETLCSRASSPGRPSSGTPRARRSDSCPTRRPARCIYPGPYRRMKLSIPRHCRSYPARRMAAAPRGKAPTAVVRLIPRLAGIDDPILPLITPGVFTAVRVARGALPFLLRGQAVFPPALLRQPGAVGRGLVPGDADYGPVLPMPARLQPIPRLFDRSLAAIVGVLRLAATASRHLPRHPRSAAPHSRRRP